LLYNNLKPLIGEAHAESFQFVIIA
jgi:hypothetical protein